MKKLFAFGSSPSTHEYLPLLIGGKLAFRNGIRQDKDTPNFKLRVLFIIYAIITPPFGCNTCPLILMRELSETST